MVIRSRLEAESLRRLVGSPPAAGPATIVALGASARRSSRPSMWRGGALLLVGRARCGGVIRDERWRSALAAGRRFQTGGLLGLLVRQRIGRCVEDGGGLGVFGSGAGFVMRLVADFVSTAGRLGSTRRASSRRRPCRRRALARPGGSPVVFEANWVDRFVRQVSSLRLRHASRPRRAPGGGVMRRGGSRLASCSLGAVSPSLRMPLLRTQARRTGLMRCQRNLGACWASFPSSTPLRASRLWLGGAVGLQVLCAT